LRRIHWHDYLTVNIYWLGLTTLAQTNGLIVPLLVQGFVGVERQATAFGLLRLYTLMVALLVQSLMGMLSDHSPLRWGRRRPFILAGTLLNLAGIVAIGASPSYLFLFGAVVLSQIASNTAQGAEQGLIPDIVPQDLRGRFSGIKAVLEIPLPVILVSFTIGPLIGGGNIGGGLTVALGILFLSMIITMFVREEPPREPPGPIDWKPFGRLVAMTLVFMGVILILGEGVKRTGQLLTGRESVAALLVVMGGAGLLAMGAAIVIGVWASTRISIGGQAARQYPSFSWWVINRLAFLVGVNNLSGFAVYFLQARLGMDGQAAAGPASKLMMLVGIMILLFAISSGWIADRIGNKRVVAFSGIGAALGTLALVLAPNMAMIYVGGCIVGAAAGAFVTANWALGTHIVPKEESGRYLGIANLAGAGAGAVGGYIGGPIADLLTMHVPQVPGLGYLLLFAIYGILFLLSVLVLTRVNFQKD